MKYQKILEQYAAKACGMTLEEALHHITEMYMDQCGVSISLRTVVYEAGEMLFALLLENPEWKQKVGDDDYLFMAMRYFHDEYTLEEYERYDITDLSEEDRDECREMVMVNCVLTSTQSVRSPFLMPAMSVRRNCVLFAGERLYISTNTECDNERDNGMQQELRVCLPRWENQTHGWPSGRLLSERCAWRDRGPKGSIVC